MVQTFIPSLNPYRSLGWSGHNSQQFLPVVGGRQLLPCMNPARVRTQGRETEAGLFGIPLILRALLMEICSRRAASALAEHHLHWCNQAQPFSSFPKWRNEERKESWHNLLWPLERHWYKEKVLTTPFSLCCSQFTDFEINTKKQNQVKTKTTAKTSKLRLCYWWRKGEREREELYLHCWSCRYDYVIYI